VAEIKLTKNALRDQQIKLGQLQRYLPTLQLKKAMLQVQAAEVRIEIQNLEHSRSTKKKAVEKFSGLLSGFVGNLGLDPKDLAFVTHVNKVYENIAGVEIPVFQSVQFKNIHYSLFESPIWLDEGVKELRDLAVLDAKVMIAKEKKEAIEKELREVSIRVNLFEKVMIPKALENIKIIKVFLGDQQLAAVARAKVAKTKIEERKALKGVES
jgi:V/A-type H+-transporting ATPase subunit D